MEGVHGRVAGWAVLSSIVVSYVSRRTELSAAGEVLHPSGSAARICATPHNPWRKRTHYDVHAQRRKASRTGCGLRDSIRAIPRPFLTVVPRAGAAGRQAGDVVAADFDPVAEKLVHAEVGYQWVLDVSDVFVLGAPGRTYARGRGAAREPHSSGQPRQR